MKIMDFEFVVDEESCETYLVVDINLPAYPFVFGDMVFALVRRTFRTIIV
jgi:hypothetical protein